MNRTRKGDMPRVFLMERRKGFIIFFFTHFKRIYLIPKPDTHEFGVPYTSTIIITTSSSNTDRGSRSDISNDTDSR